MTNIPLLLVGRGLIDLANDMGELGAQDKVTPILAIDPEDALSVYSNKGPRLMAVVLEPEAEEAYRQLTDAGYRGAFLVYGEETEKWFERGITFLDPGDHERDNYNKIMQRLLE